MKEPTMDALADLSRRERQIMEIVFARGDATVNQIRTALPEAPTDGAVRTLLRILEQKGHVKRRKQGREHVFVPRLAMGPAGESALRRVIRTFFGGSLEKALGAYLAGASERPSEEELRRAAELIRAARLKADKTPRGTTHKSKGRGGS